MKNLFFATSLLLISSAFAATTDGFYTNGVSASSAKGAHMLLTDLMTHSDNHKVCYVGNYEDALKNVHRSISISVYDVYGEAEFPPLDVEVTGKMGQSASGIISACRR